MPWVQVADNFVPLRTLAWMGQVHGEPGEGLLKACTQSGLPLDRFAWTDDSRQAGLQKDALYLIRPDGYVALAADNASAASALTDYQARHDLRFQPAG